MKTSDDLFLLIKAMTGTEKRYFKLFSGLYDRDKNYLKLFNAIVKQKNNYDEKKLTNGHKKEKWVSNISITKYELYNAILNSMEVYHKNDTIDARLASYLNQANLLFNKRLIKLAKKMIARIEKLALIHEKHHYLLMANSLKLGMMRLTTDVKDIKQYINKGGIETEKHYLDCLKNTAKFYNINLQLTNAKERYVDSGEREKIKKLFNLKLLKSPTTALTFLSLQNYYYAHYIRYILTGEWGKKAYLQQKEWIDFLEKNKNLLLFRAENYLSGLVRLIGVVNHSDHKNELELIFIKAKKFYQNLPAKNKMNVLKSMFMSVTSNYMEGQIILHKPQKAIEAWEGIKHLISYESLGDESKMVTCVNLSYAHFLKQEYRQANQFLTKIINYTEQVRLDIQVYARILILFVQFELGNYDSLSYISETSKRYLLKYKLLGKFEKRVIRFFQRDIFKYSAKETKSILYSQAKNDFTKLLSFSEAHTSENFDVISWLESKVEGKTFAEVVREKAKAIMAKLS